MTLPTRPQSSLDARAAALIADLQLEPHPEGGCFRRIYRSSLGVEPMDGRALRPALTTIYYLLAAGEHSRWHRVRSDEVWHFYEGDALELFWIDVTDTLRRETLSAGPSGHHVSVVPAGCWQAARSTGAYSLVGCTVAPGFDFEDFEMVDDRSDGRERLERTYPGLPDLF